MPPIINPPVAPPIGPFVQVDRDGLVIGSTPTSPTEASLNVNVTGGGAVPVPLPVIGGVGPPVVVTPAACWPIIPCPPLPAHPVEGIVGGVPAPVIGTAGGFPVAISAPVAIPTSILASITLPTSDVHLFGPFARLTMTVNPLILDLVAAANGNTDLVVPAGQLWLISGAHVILATSVIGAFNNVLMELIRGVTRMAVLSISALRSAAAGVVSDSTTGVSIIAFAGDIIRVRQMVVVGNSTISAGITVMAFAVAAEPSYSLGPIST